MNRKINWRRIKHAFASAIAVGALAVTINSVGCSNNGSTPTTAVLVGPDGYVYYVYYPDDLSVSSYYWVDDWDYAGLYVVGTSGPVTTVADAVRALARGEDVCGAAAVVTARTRTPVCTGGPTASRGGATIVFTDCHTAGGGTINGTVDITSSGSATTAACTGGTTMITTTHTTTITGLTYVGPNGVKAVIPQQTDTGTNTYMFGSAPASITLATMGQLQTYGPDGALISDTSYAGSPTISFGGSTSNYTMDGTFTTTNNLLSTGATYTLTGVTRVGTCCRPVGGTVQATRDNVSNTFTFGPACGDVTLDGVISANVPQCF